MAGGEGVTDPCAVRCEACPLQGYGVSMALVAASIEEYATPDQSDAQLAERAAIALAQRGLWASPTFVDTKRGADVGRIVAAARLKSAGDCVPTVEHVSKG
jgi:hypothetical protein